MTPYVMVAPTGARRSKADHPALPITPEEIAQSAKACHAAGAHGLHLHVRDSEGQHSLDPGLYRDVIGAVADVAPALDVQVTTEAAGRFSTQDQLSALEKLSPTWASVSLREIAQDPMVARRIYALSRDRGIVLQHIVYDANDAKLLADWQTQGLLGESESVILVLGRYALGVQSQVKDIAPLRAALPPVGRWMLCAFGPNEHACLRAAASMGGDVRVGFENALVDADGILWPDVAASVSALTAPWRQAA